MRDLEKYRGVIPAFYACYDEDGEISGERTEALALHFLKKGVKGLYVNGSSGECIYQSVEDRKKVLEHVMKVVGGKLTIIAHVACNNTKDSVELAAHAEKLGVDAIAAIPMPAPTHCSSGIPVRQLIHKEEAEVFPAPISPKLTTLQPAA